MPNRTISRKNCGALWGSCPPLKERQARMSRSILRSKVGFAGCRGRGWGGFLKASRAMFKVFSAPLPYLCSAERINSIVRSLRVFDVIAKLWSDASPRKDAIISNNSRGESSRNVFKESLGDMLIDELGC